MHLAVAVGASRDSRMPGARRVVPWAVSIGILRLESLNTLMSSELTTGQLQPISPQVQAHSGPPTGRDSGAWGHAGRRMPRGPGLPEGTVAPWSPGGGSTLPLRGAWGARGAAQRPWLASPSPVPALSPLVTLGCPRRQSRF